MNKKVKKILMLIIILLFILGISLSSYLYFNGFDFEKYFLENNISNNYKILIILVIYLFRNYLLIPSTVIILFAGFFLRDFWLTLLVSIIGVSIGICQTYFVGYVFGEDLRNNKHFKLISKYNEKIQKDGFKVIFVGAFFPIIPVDILYYSSGFIKYNFLKSFLAGILGELPLIILYVYLGEKAHKYSNYLVYVALVLLVLYILYLLLKKYILKNKLQKQ